MKPIEFLKEAITYNNVANAKKALEQITLQELINHNKNNKLLSICTKNYSKELLTELLNHGLDINTQNTQGLTILNQLISQKNNEKMKKDFMFFLLDKGMNVNLKDNQGKSIFSYLVSHAHDIEELEKIKSHHQFDINWQDKDNKGNTIIHLLVDTNEAENITSLIDYCVLKGVKISEKNNLGNNVLDVAIAKSTPSIIQKLSTQYKLNFKSDSLYFALNTLKEKNVIEAINHNHFDINDTHNNLRLIDICISLNQLNALKALSKTEIWTEENVSLSLDNYRSQFGNIFEIDDDVKNTSLEFAKTSLIYFEKERLDKMLNQNQGSDNPRVKV